MKRLFFLCTLIAGMLSCGAQNIVDSFNVGPYKVEYHGQGDARYRLVDGIDLYEFFDLQRDTTVIMQQPAVEPVTGAFELSLQLGTNINIAKEFKLAGLWKQAIGSGMYFNAGVSLGLDYASAGRSVDKLSVFEVGVPLQIELSNLNRQSPSLYGLFGVTPAFYTTMEHKQYGQNPDGPKSDGFMISPALELGCNVPFDTTVIRLGVYAHYLVNCNKGDYDVIRGIGRAYVGGKLGFVF